MVKIVKKYSSGGVLFDDDKVLLIHWDPPRSSYDFPKGGIEWYENSKRACIREVREETGYATKILGFIGQTRYDYDWKDGTHHDKKVDYYLLELLDRPVSKPSRELYETFEDVWVPIDEALTKLTRDIDKDILEKALKMKAKLKV